MKARQNSQLRLLLLTMSLLNKLPPPKIGNPLQVAMTGVLEVVILSGVLKAVMLNGVLEEEKEEAEEEEEKEKEERILSGVLEVVPVPTGLPLPLPPPRMPKSLLSGLTAVPGTVKRKSQTTR